MTNYPARNTTKKKISTLLIIPLLIIPTLFLTGQIDWAQGQEDPTVVSAASENRGQASSFVPSSLSMHPGEVKLLLLEIPEDRPDSELTCDGKNQGSHWTREGRRLVFLAESYFSERNHFVCTLKLRDQTEITVAKIHITKKDYPSERLNVEPKHVKLKPKDQARVNQERILLEEVYSKSAREPLFVSGFVKPSKKKITSVYGSRRVFNNNKQTQHLGTDFRAAIGEKVFSSNRGRVLLARDLFYTGNTIIIDHGLNLFTLYGHLSQFSVKEGDWVEKKQLLGKAGNSGRVTGPHLHWGVKAGSLHVDGLSLVASTQDLNLASSALLAEGEDEASSAMTPINMPKKSAE